MSTPPAPAAPAAPRKRGRRRLTRPGPRSLAVYDLLVHAALTGAPTPTYAEIGAALHMVKSNVWYHIHALLAAGLLTHAPATHRAIQIVPPAASSCPPSAMGGGRRQPSVGDARPRRARRG